MSDCRERLPGGSDYLASDPKIGAQRLFNVMSCAFVLTAKQRMLILEALRTFDCFIDEATGQSNIILSWCTSGLRAVLAYEPFFGGLQLAGPLDQPFSSTDPVAVVVNVHHLVRFFHEMTLWTRPEAFVHLSIRSDGSLHMVWENQSFKQYLTCRTDSWPPLPTIVHPKDIRTFWGDCPTHFWPALHEALALHRAACSATMVVCKASGYKLDGNVLGMIRDAVTGWVPVLPVP